MEWQNSANSSVTHAPIKYGEIPPLIQRYLKEGFIVEDVVLINTPNELPPSVDYVVRPTLNTWKTSGWWATYGISIIGTFTALFLGLPVKQDTLEVDFSLSLEEVGTNRTLVAQNYATKVKEPIFATPWLFAWFYGHFETRDINENYEAHDLFPFVSKSMKEFASSVQQALPPSNKNKRQDEGLLDKGEEISEQLPQENMPPKISIYEPDISQRAVYVVSSDHIRVVGKAEDSDGIYEVTVNGIQAELENHGHFLIDVQLGENDEFICVIATDKRKNSSMKKFALGKKKESDNQSIEKRLALIIGNSQYRHIAALKNPVNDAASMKRVLESLGFRVLYFENADQKKFKQAIDEFGSELDDYSVSLFFYAGHGIQVDGVNYLIPVDANIKKENEVEYETVRADRALAKMDGAKTTINIVILDACRDNPFARSWRGTAGNGLAMMDAPTGTLIAYATSPGKTASDNVGNNNGTYTSAILEHIRTPNITIEELFKRVRGTVIETTNNAQVPWESTCLRGNFYFYKQ
jgi:hypothetical protein